MNIRNKKSNKKTVIAALSLASLITLSPFAQAANKHGSYKHNNTAVFTDYANVTRVDPIYKQVAYQQPTQQCWYEHSQHQTQHHGHSNHRRDRHAGQTIVGGIVGGVIGNQIGRHTGSHKARIGATVAGAIVGSALANESGSRHRDRHANKHGWPHTTHTVTESQPVKHCREVYETQHKRKIVGYNVTYRYRGRTHTTHMQRDPGHKLPIRVSLSPQG